MSGEITGLLITFAGLLGEVSLLPVTNSRHECVFSTAALLSTDLLDAAGMCVGVAGSHDLDFGVACSGLGR